MAKLVDIVTVEDCSEDEALVDALLEEEQLDFSFSNDDCCDGSPLPSPPAAPALPLVTAGGSPPNTSTKATPPSPLPLVAVYGGISYFLTDHLLTVQSFKISPLIISPNHVPSL